MPTPNDYAICFVGKCEHPNANKTLYKNGILSTARLNSETTAIVKDLKNLSNGQIVHLWDNVAAKDKSVFAGPWDLSGDTIDDARKKIEEEMKSRGFKFDFMFYYRLYKERKRKMREEKTI